MKTNIQFLKGFSKKMLTLAVLIGIIVALTMPITYFLLTWAAEKDHAENLGKLIEPRIIETIKENPDLWKYNVQKFAQVSSQFDEISISNIVVWDDANHLFLKQEFSNSIFTVNGRTPINYNNHLYGYIDIGINADALVYFTGVMTVAFVLFGGLVGLILFRFPTRIVRAAQEQIDTAFEELNHANKKLVASQQEINESEAMFRAIFEQAAVGIAYFDIKGKLLRTNQRLSLMMGYSHEELTQLSFFDFTHPDDIPRSENNLKMLVDGSINNYSVEKRYVRKDRTVIDAQINVSLIKDIEDHPIYCIAVIEDISKRKQAERKVLEYHELIRKELELAEIVQRELLPNKLPSIPQVTFTWKFMPCTYVAGDMFNILMLDENYLGLYILDVKGHGVSAALTAIAINYFLKRTGNAAYSKEDQRLFHPAETVNALNQRFGEFSKTGSFFTIFYGVLDLQSLELTYSRAGHPAPVLINKEGRLYSLDNGDIPVGMEEGAFYQEYCVQFRQGDKFILYTDGLTEAHNDKDILFSTERFEKILSTDSRLAINDLVNLIVSKVTDHMGSIQANDDIAILGFEIL